MAYLVVLAIISWLSVYKMKDRSHQTLSHEG
jgi:hypothetical protein